MAALEQLIAEQSDPESGNYQKFLSPQEFADRFGTHPADIETITNWLQSYGLQIEEVAAGNGFIVFNGTVAQVSRAFETEIRHYTVDGVMHLANATDPKIPVNFAGAVGGLLRLHDFQYDPYSRIATKKTLSQGIAQPLPPLGYVPSPQRTTTPSTTLTLC